MDRFCQEVSRTATLYLQGKESRDLKNLYLSGGASKTEGLGKQLSFVLGQNIKESLRPAPPFESLPVNLEAWAPAIGLAHDHSMSLLPEQKGLLKKPRVASKISKQRAETRARKLTTNKKPLSKKLLLLFVLIGIFLAFLWAQKVRNDERGVSREVAALESVVNSSKELGAAASVPERESRLRVELKNLPQWSRVREVLQKAESEKLKLKQFVIANKSIEIVFTDPRLPEEIEKVFPGSTVSEAASGDKTMRIDF
jgi:hypothetical protein